MDYRELASTEPDAVIYCDPPYRGTRGYFREDGSRIAFDHARLYDWVESVAALPVISEREMPTDRFACVAERAGRNTLCATKNTPTVERLFVPKKRLDEYRSRLRGDE